VIPIIMSMGIAQSTRIRRAMARMLQVGGADLVLTLGRGCDRFDHASQACIERAQSNNPRICVIARIHSHIQSFFMNLAAGKR
jgi:hypothetical protein